MGSKRQDPDAVVRAMFGGRRDGERAQKTIWVEVRSATGALRGRTIDISRSGILLCFDNAKELDSADELQAYAAEVQEALGSACLASLHYGLVMRRLRLVRVTQGGLGGSVVPLLAFKFDRKLSDKECVQIGAPISAPLVDELIGA